MKLYRPTKRNDDDNTLGEAWVQIIFHSKNGNKRKYEAEVVQPRDCGEDTALVREIAEESGIEFSDERVRYVTVQMTKSTWYKLQARFAAMKEQT